MTGSEAHARACAPWLWGLTGAFALRVIAQPLARVWEQLPSFETWHSGALPYGWLVLSQLLILGVMGGVSLRFSRGRVTPSRGLGLALLILGGVYLAVMFARLGLGLTLLRGDSWFDRPLPTFFHLVLASFLLAVGRYHRSAAR